MISEREVAHIADLADIGITKEELAEFTAQFNPILEYFDILDQVEGAPCPPCETFNVMREDEVAPSLTQEAALMNAQEAEDGFFRAPRVM